ncbi:MAG: glycosyltransferase [Flavobacteriaceae bacterium]
MKVLWVHNYQNKSQGTFMWDALDAVREVGTADVEEFTLPLKPGWGEARSAIRALRSKAREFDLVHAQYGSLVGLAGALSGKPLVLTLRGSDVYGTGVRGFSGFAQSFPRTVLTKFAAMRASRIVTVSEALGRIAGGWPFVAQENVVTFPSPVGDMFAKSPALSEVRRTPLRIAFVSANRDNPLKRRELVEKAVQLCQSVGLDIQLEIVGGKSRSEVRESIESCDAIALASTHEGWPNVIKEAMFVGLPFVSTDVSDLRTFAGPMTPNKIVATAAPIGFAQAFIDLAVRKTVTELRDAAPLIGFLPLTQALNNCALYNSMKPRQDAAR